MRHHSILRFIVDIVLLIVLVFLILSPLLLVFSLKISNSDLRSEIFSNVAGKSTQRN